MTDHTLCIFFVLSLLLLTITNAKNCTVKNTVGQDDSPAILEAFQNCAEDSHIIFQKTNYSAFTPISLVNLKNVTVHLNGNLLLPNNITAIQKAMNATKIQPNAIATPWFYIHGSEVTLRGSDDPDWGAFHGFGQQWWDTGNRILRPQLGSFNVTNGTISKLKVIKPVAWGWIISGQNIRIENHYMDAKPNNSSRDSTISFPFNTDGLNLSGQNITVDGYTGWNGDDCVSVINGARDIKVLNGYCGFSSHGLSIGSLGRNGSVQTVANVLFNNWTMDGAVYGARFKSWAGGNGFAQNITWTNINLIEVSTAIFVTQNYYDQDKGPRPENTNGTSTHISNFHYENFTGSLNKNWTDGSCISTPCWNYVQEGDATQSIIFDLYNYTATNLTFAHIDVHPHGEDSNATTVICDPSTLAPGEQDTLGFNCTRGPFKVSATGPGSSSGASSATSVKYSQLPIGVLAAIVGILARAFL